MTIPEQCDATAPWSFGDTLHCDRERGHVGPHRAYDYRIDEPIFWPNVKPPGVTGQPDDGGSRGTPGDPSGG